MKTLVRNSNGLGGNSTMIRSMATVVSMVTASSFATVAYAADDLAKANAVTGSRQGVCIENEDVNALRKRLTLLSLSGVSTTSYAYAKAQCWLDSAESQHFENDRTGYVADGIGEAITLVASLEADKNAASKPVDTRHIAASERLREDLWQQIADIKGQSGFSCGAARLACAEVKLVRAGHANYQTGWRQANPYIHMAERLLSQAREDAAACNKTDLPTPTVVPTPTTPHAIEKTTTETFSLQADALYQFNRGDKANLLPAGRAKLEWLITRLKDYHRIDKIEVNGYTDRLGSEKYNQVLSQTRANTVRDYLIAGGIKSERLTAMGRGKSDTAGSRCPDNLGRQKLIACLQPDRRVELLVSGIAKK